MGGQPALRQRIWASISAHLLSAIGNQDPQFPDLVLGKQRGSCLGAIPRGPCLGPRDSLALFSYSLFIGEFLSLFLAVSIIFPIPFALWPSLAPNFLLNLQLYPYLFPCPSGPRAR